MKLTLYEGHVLDALKQMPNVSVDCIITSPPYYALRSYKGAETVWDGAWKGQLGLESTHQMYLDHLLLTTNELKRVLKKSGTMFWNMGDSYGSSKSDQSNLGNAEPVKELGRKPSIKGFEKTLMMLPERLAMRMIDEQGWILRNNIPWIKRNAMPSSVKDRFSNKWEYIFFFTKSGKYYFDLDSVRKPLSEGTIKRISEKNIEGQFQEGKVKEFGETTGTGNMKKALVNLQKRNSFNIRVRDAKKGILKEKWGNLYNASEEEVANYDEKRYTTKADETALLFRGKGSGGNLDYNGLNGLNGLNSDNGSHYSENGANPGDILEINTHPHPFAHFAVYPEQLVEPLIKAGCPRDGIVLDPFNGSGTTMLVAKKLGRSAIGIEIVPEYNNIAKERLQWGNGLDIEFEFNALEVNK